MRVAWSLSVLALALMPQAQAAGLCPAQPVRLSFYEAGLFYFDGKGIDREVADELQRRTGCAIVTSAPPRARAYVWLESGETDIVMAALNNPKRDHYAAFIPYMQQRFVTVMHRDVPADKASLAAFSGDSTLRFGAVRGVTYGGGRDVWFARIEEQRRHELGASLPTMFRMLKSKRFAAMFAIPLQYEKELADLGMRDQVRLIDWFPDEPPAARCLAMSRKNFTPAQIKGWAEVVRGMRADGSLRRILANHLSAEETAKAVVK